MAEIGQKVVVHYRGTLDDGNVFEDTYKSGRPVEFVVGSQTMLPGFELAVAQMEPGEVRHVRIPFMEAYGAYDESLLITIPAAVVPSSVRLIEGSRYFVKVAGEMASVTVVSRDGNSFIVDCNHELAGKDLNFCIEYVGLASESVIEQEHNSDCSCGCHKLKEQLGA